MSGPAALPWTAAEAAAQAMAAQAVQVDEARIALELVETVIRDLYRVGLGLTSATQRVGEPLQQYVTDALDGIDEVIRTIRTVVFDLGSLRPPGQTSWRDDG